MTPLDQEVSKLDVVASSNSDDRTALRTASVSKAAAMEVTDAGAIFSDGLDISQSPPHAAARPASRQRTAFAAGQKRGSSEPGGRPPRGRPDTPWLDDIRAVHHRIEFDRELPLR